MTKEEMDNFLISIGGLENGYFTDRAVITDSYFFECDAGWYSIIKDLIEKLIEIGWDKQVMQVKEKFGGLRFYANSLPEGGSELIRDAENKSFETCEICGEPGEIIKNSGWLKCLCDKHKLR
jgi:hypothetical protein